MAHPNLGRHKASEKYTSVPDYLNGHIFPIEDQLELLKEAERKAEKVLAAAKYNRSLKEQKLQNAYKGLRKWKK